MAKKCIQDHPHLISVMVLHFTASTLVQEVEVARSGKVLNEPCQSMHSSAVMCGKYDPFISCVVTLSQDMQSCAVDTLSRSSSCEVLLALPVTTILKRSLMAASPCMITTCLCHRCALSEFDAVKQLPPQIASHVCSNMSSMQACQAHRS